MDDETPPLITKDPRDAAERSLIDDVKQLAQDGRTLLEAELAYQKSRAAVAGKGLKGVARWGALALALAFFALMALVLGLLLALSEQFGAWAALGMVMSGLIVATLVAALTAKRRWNRMSDQLSSEELPQ